MIRMLDAVSYYGTGYNEKELIFSYKEYEGGYINHIRRSIFVFPAYYNMVLEQAGSRSYMPDALHAAKQ
jgi:hypothetical protein